MRPLVKQLAFVTEFHGDYMSKAIENLQAAQQRAIAARPKLGGFPYLAETLRNAGVLSECGVLELAVRKASQNTVPPSTLQIECWLQI